MFCQAYANFEKNFVGNWLAKGPTNSLLLRANVYDYLNYRQESSDQRDKRARSERQLGSKRKYGAELRKLSVYT